MIKYNDKYDTLLSEYKPLEIACNKDAIQPKNALYSELDKNIDFLIKAHTIEWENYIKEAAKAEQLRIFIENHKLTEINCILANSIFIRKKMLDCIFECAVGHNAGRSKSAQSELKQILELIDNDILAKYFNNNEFLNSTLCWKISCENSFGNWQEILNYIWENKFSNISVKRPNFERMQYRQISEMISKWKNENKDS